MPGLLSKSFLSSLQYGASNLQDNNSVQAFYKELNTAKREKQNYETACVEYEKIYGEKVVNARSVREKIRQKEQIVKYREASRVHRARQKDKGVR